MNAALVFSVISEKYVVDSPGFYTFVAGLVPSLTVAYGALALAFCTLLRKLKGEGNACTSFQTSASASALLKQVLQVIFIRGSVCSRKYIILQQLVKSNCPKGFRSLP
jgi:hypothetical protein